MKNIPDNLSNLKSKVDKLDVDKLVPVPVYLSKLSNVVKNNVLKKDIYIYIVLYISEVKGEIPSTANLATTAALNTKINEVKGKIPNITNLAITIALTAVGNKIPNVSNLVKKLTIIEKSMRLKRKLLIMIMVNLFLLQI